jgi:subtilisin family serine protease/putative cell wall-binding protein
MSRRGARTLALAALIAVSAVVPRVPAAADTRPVRLVVHLGATPDKVRADLDDVVLELGPLHTVVVEVAAGAAGATADRLRAAGAEVELDPPVSAAAAIIPDDPYFSDSWAMQVVRAPAAWGRTTGSASTKVAILDTGVDATHPDLDGAVVDGTDLVNDDADPADDNGHGTGVAGIVAARGNNGRGSAGYCWSCSLLSVKVLDANGDGESSTVAAGIVWAVDAGASIINLSLSSPSSSFVLADAVAYAIAHGVVVIAAGGNAGLVQPTYPAAYPGVVGVVATDPDDELYDWSNRGTWATLAAPGCHVTTIDSSYDELCGTSSAAPAVAGIIALARSVAPSASATRLIAAAVGSAQPIEGSDAGRISASGTIGAVLRNDVAAGDGGTGPTTDGRPGVPRGVRVRLDGGAAVVSWAAPADAAKTGVDGYVIEATPGPMTIGVAAPATEAVVGGLASGVTYRFTVAASNEHGTGPAASASAPVTPTAEGVERVAGAGRVLTSIALSQRTFTASGTVVLARADEFADALTAAPLAARFGAPLLLTAAGTGAIEAEVGDEVRRLGATQVQVVGGIGGPDSAFERSLAGYGVTTFTRTGGVDRFETARLVAAQVGGTQVYVANGLTGWPDAIAASALAAVQGRPILLVSDTSVPQATRSALLDLGVDAATIVGGTGTVPDSLAAAIADPGDDGTAEVAVSRIAGADRYETSRRLADIAVGAGADPSRAWLANGRSWPDALAAGPAVAARGGVLLLVRGDDLEQSPGAAHWLSEHASTLSEVVLVGGGASIGPEAESQVRTRVGAG